MPKYNFTEIEKKWQKYWEENKTFQAKDVSDKEKYYALIEFPYPSGAGLHVGHPRSYTALDVICRKKRMEGKNVLYPIGFDAFGLPTENFAIKTGRPPAEVTEENIANFTKQLKMLGFGFDWDRAVNTTDPNYYKWTQWIFLQFFKNGLAYKKKMPINWCLSCKIGLANEEVVDGKCERCGGDVEKRDKEQWMLAITKYADKLLSGLKDVDYISQVKIQQDNWIGRSEGARVLFKIKDSDYSLEVFTTRPDTLFGATYMVVSPEHGMITEMESKIENIDEVKDYIQKSKLKTDLERTDLQKEKTGVEIKGIKAINPVNNEEIPIFVADYVLISYGTGAIMAVPAHDTRDFEFAQKYDLPVKTVVSPKFASYMVIELSLKKEALKKVLKEEFGKIEIEKTDKEWGKFIRVHADISKEKEFINFLESNLLPASPGDGGAWYADSIGTTNMAVFPNKNIKITNKESLNEFKEYGRSLGIPDDELNIKLEDTCFSGEGFNINSQILDDLETNEAKDKILKFLEERNIGDSKVNYKLRDWVFSRQRYWGEPIPLVYCEKCAKIGQKVLLIHGFKGGGEQNWLPWMKTELEKRGFEVFNPTLPEPDHPDLKAWLDVLTPYIEKMGESDVVVGHSLGSKAALHLLERSNKKIGYVYLVASAIGSVEKRDWEKLAQDHMDWDLNALKKFWAEPLDWQKATNNISVAKSIIVSDDDLSIPSYTHDNIPAGWYLRLLSGYKHFTKEKYPCLLEIISQSKINGWMPVPESALPLELPKVDKYEPTDTGESPLSAMENWVKTECPLCGGPARRETDTMPNWAGSSWYFLRYLDPQNEQEFASRDKLKYWMPVDWYNGGMEHVVLHLLYSRFWNQFLYDLGYVPVSEPYAKRTSHGMILAKGGEKMSKSKGNVVNPDDIVKEYGADVLRTYIMFMGPFDQAVEWDTNGLVGVRRFLERIWGMQAKVDKGKNVEEKNIEAFLHKNIKKVTDDIDNMYFNTAVAALMEFSHELNKSEKIKKQTFEIFIKLLSPFAPHMCEEIWRNLGNGESICDSSWPKYDSSSCAEEKLTIAVQINGKVRDELQIQKEISEDDLKKIILERPQVRKHLGDKTIKKFIYIQGKLVSIVA